MENDQKFSKGLYAKRTKKLPLFRVQKYPSTLGFFPKILTDHPPTDIHGVGTKSTDPPCCKNKDVLVFTRFG